MFKSAGVLCAVVGLAACGAPQSQGDSVRRAASSSVAAAAGVGVYRIDGSNSEIRLLVRRAGPLARLGHNHVIVNRSIGGWVRFNGDAAAASFQLMVPAAGFVIDDAAARKQEGEDFADDVPDDAKSSTRRNMLSTALLDADEFPIIAVASVAVTQDVASVEISVAGHVSRLVVPFALVVSSERLLGTGILKVRQSQLGLTPFSIMLGALQVQDELTVKFDFTAVP